LLEPSDDAKGSLVTIVTPEDYCYISLAAVLIQ
jgi:hypothetical protein